MELALSEPRLAAVTPFYGSVEIRDRKVLVPFQAHYGSEDHLPAEMYEDVRAHLSDVAGSEFQRYEGAPHALMNDTRDSYRAAAAALAWERLASFLHENRG